ncbi:AlpA family phage regulatory protein [Castellaniella sp. MT123]|uniref:helix-turn-helix transcriptional regulator n=1 Tax=Castellaniella sp. MT123 TaxID=3140381 RepID=UPI0031F34DA6
MSDTDTAQAAIPDTQLPATGFSRQPAVRKFAGGVASSTLWLWVRQGKIPAPVKISPRVAAWRNEELHAWATDPLAWQAQHKGL